MTNQKHAVAMTAGIAVLTVLIMVAGDGGSTAAAQGATEVPTEAATAVATATLVANTTVSGPIPQYGLFETQFAVDVQVKNVFDPAQIDVIAQFTGPDGQRVSVPAFWMQPYQQTCNQNCSVEILNPAGQAGWRVRFSPALPGNWTYKIDARDQTSTRTVAQGQFTVTPSKRPGFIRIGKNRHYFGYDNGSPYFLIGSNLGWSWSGANGTLGYQNWLRKLHDVGANYGRLFINVPWFIGLDWKTPVGDYIAAQEDAWRLDTVLQTAEEQGIALQVVLLWSQGFTAYGGLPVNPPATPGRPDISADWADNPYNYLLGGPFNSPTLYFSSDQGRTFFKNSLRHIIARWGYSTSVFAWEVIDQLDKVPGTSPDMPSDWLREMVNYLRQIDPYRHLITAGLRDNAKAALLDRAVLDFKQVRYYQRRPIEPAVDQVPGTLATLAPILSNADRPVLMSEFSLNPWFEPTADDPTGIHVRQTMWATALSGAAGAAASWWWDTYLFPQNLVDIYAPLAAFTRGIPWNSGDLQPVNVSLIGDASIAYQPYKVSGYNGTFGGPRAPDLTYRLTPDGVVPPITNASSFLYGVTYNTQLSQPHKYIITPPVDTKLTIHVRRVSDRASARLVVIIDGKTVAELALSPHSEPCALSVPVSAGEHTVVLDNLGDDYLQIDSLDIADYITPLRTLALADRTTGIFLAWLQNREYTWQNVARNISAKPVTMSLSVGGMPPGMYRLELWDPITGNVVGQEDETIPGTRDGPLSFDLLPIANSLAVRAIRIAEPGNAPSPTPTLTPTPRILSTPVTPTVTKAP
jgi:hypothetical protein